MAIQNLCDLNLKIIFLLIAFKVTNLIMSEFYYFSNGVASRQNSIVDMYKFNHSRFQLND